MKRKNLLLIARVAAIVIAGSIVSLQTIALLLPKSDVESAKFLESRGARFQKKTRAPLLALMLDSPNVFDYGPIWNVGYSGPIDDALFDALSTAAELEQLAFVNCTIADHALSGRLQSLKRVDHFMLIDSEFNDDDMVHVAAMRRVRSLTISKCGIGNLGILNLAPLKSLRVLILDSMQVDQEAIDQFRALRPDVRYVRH